MTLLTKICEKPIILVSYSGPAAACMQAVAIMSKNLTFNISSCIFSGGCPIACDLAVMARAAGLFIAGFGER